MDMDVFGHEACCLSLPVPLRILITIFLLHRTLGWSIFAGVAIMVINIPLNLRLTAEKRKVSKDQMRNRDARAQLMVACSLSTPLSWLDGGLMVASRTSCCRGSR